MSRIEVYVDKEQKFSSASWWAKSPDFVIETLRLQLEAAAAIWPELKQFVVIKRGSSQSRVERGAAGGHARAAALTPERRQEIARKAVETRWGARHGEPVESDKSNVANPDGTTIS